MPITNEGYPVLVDQAKDVRTVRLKLSVALYVARSMFLIRLQLACGNYFSGGTDDHGRH